MIFASIEIQIEVCIMDSVVTLRIAPKNSCSESYSFSTIFYTRKAFYYEDTKIFIKLLHPNCK